MFYPYFQRQNKNWKSKILASNNYINGYVHIAHFDIFILPNIAEAESSNISRLCLLSLLRSPVGWRQTREVPFSIELSGMAKNWGMFFKVKSLSALH